MQRYTVYFIWKLLYMLRVVPSPIIRSTNNSIYSIWYLSHHYCYLPLLWKSWNWFECAVGGVRHPQHEVCLNSFYTLYHCGECHGLAHPCSQDCLSSTHPHLINTETESRVKWQLEREASVWCDASAASGQH